MKSFKVLSERIVVLVIGSILVAIGCKKEDAKLPPTIPVVATAALTNITTTGATGGGSIVSDGGATITASGIVWSKTNATPTLADSVVAGTTTTGTFSVNITGLEFDNSYYIRAFATNSVGTGYGDVVTLNTSNDTNKVKFTYNGAEVVYEIIVSPTTGKKWLDRNLGAKQVATAFDDYKAYGDLFQWGRPDDGHQLMIWTNSTTGARVNGTTTEAATSDAPGHSNFILSIYVDDPTWTGDWRDDNNRNRWAAIPQGPCPAGWHVPDFTEWQAESASGGITDRTTAFSKLKLTAAGRLSSENGQVAGDQPVTRPGGTGYYWSSSDKVDLDPFSYAKGWQFGDKISYNSEALKAEAYSVRCIKD